MTVQRVADFYLTALEICVFFLFGDRLLPSKSCPFSALSFFFRLVGVSQRWVGKLNQVPEVEADVVVEIDTLSSKETEILN